MTATFIGHANYVGADYTNLKAQLEYLVEAGVTDFLCGGMGGFDNACAALVRKMKKTYPQIQLYRVVPSLLFDKRREMDYDGIIVPCNIEKCHYKRAITFRNRYMIDHADFALCYVRREHGGAYQSYRYAKKKNISIIYIGKKE